MKNSVLFFIILGCSTASHAEVPAQQLQDVYNSPDFLSFLSQTRCPQLEGNTPENVEKYYDFKLRCAVRAGDIVQVKHWLHKNAQPESGFFDAAYCVHYATEQDRTYGNLPRFQTKEKLENAIEILTLIVDVAKNINFQDGDGNTLLHYAALELNLFLVEFLLKKGIDPTIQNNRSEKASESVSFIFLKCFNEFSKTKDGLRAEEVLIKAEQEWNEKYKTV